MNKISGGFFTPLYSFSESNSKGKKASIFVTDFYMDRLPVTNGDYLIFTRKSAKFRKSTISPIYADAGYLRHWHGDHEFDVKISNFPVTNISWFAAKAYCESVGKKLPSENQWEYVAAAGEKTKNALNDPRFIQTILDWYGRPNSLRNVGEQKPNYWGITDLHGLVWEWVEDFNANFITGESRADSALEKNLYCGSGALNSSNFRNYAAFMRFAFRNSLQAKYTVANLGFRCIKEK